MHFVHSPQPSSIGESGLNGMFVISSPRYTKEPNSGVIIDVFFPLNPIPARSATARSESSPVSTISLLANQVFAVLKMLRVSIFFYAVHRDNRSPTMHGKKCLF